MNRSHLLLTATLVFPLAACASTERDVLRQDRQGNYATTSEYESMQRSEFLVAMRSGLADFDSRLAELRERANELGGESLQEFAECEGSLREQREQVANQLEVVETALADDWPDERAEAVEEYEDLREALAEAYDEVLDT